MKPFVSPDFSKFSKLIHARFVELSKNELFVVSCGENDIVWEQYLDAFPLGTNPLYKTRTEYDCSCCKNFVRNIGNVVSIVDGKLQSIWNVEGAEYPLNVVAEKLDALITSLPITGLFRKSEKTFGNDVTKQLLPDGEVKKWNHFYGVVANRHFSTSVDEVRGDYKTTTQVFRRGLEELSVDAVQSVIDLIESNNLYRGQEHMAAIEQFRKSQNKYLSLKTDGERSIFVWENASSPASRFRNTVIGTLVQDISSGVDLEAAVRSFEVKVAPTNYKRPTALITPKMVKDAMETIQELDLEDSLKRRFAKISDVSVNNVLWVDNSVKGKMKDGVENLLMSVANAPKNTKDMKAEDISIDDFMLKVLPLATSIEMLVANNHVNNFMSLTAPEYPDSGKLFKWNNDFAWSYDGNITDSIKEKVKAAGGNVTNAKMRVSLAWYNFDDLDIYVTEPNGNEICFHNKSGKLDVDMNAGRGTTRTPVENVSWTSVADGTYQVHVHQYSQRESSSVGCVVEIENAGILTHLSYDTIVKGKKLIAKIFVRNGNIEQIFPAVDVVGGAISQDKWGLKTETFAKVNSVMFSPNYWDDNKVGNKHWFFILDNCKNDSATRGIYNEFLNSSLEKHRKVFEVLGDKTKCQPTDDQLSGLGFSSTRGDTVTVKVIGNKFQKSFNIKF